MSYKWTPVRDRWLMSDDTGRVLATVRKTAIDIYQAVFEGSSVREYLSMGDAQVAMEKLAQEFKLREEKERSKLEEKKDGKDTTEKAPAGSAGGQGKSSKKR